MADDDNFLVFAAIGAVLVVAGGLYRPLAKRYSEISLMTAGLVQMIVGLGGLAMVSWSLFQGGGGTDLTAVPNDQGGSLKTAFYIASAFAVWGFAFVNPSVSALVSRSADSSEQGEVLGVNQSFASLGRILGPLVGSLLFAAHSSHAMPFVVAVLTLFCVGAILVNVTRSITKLND
jgi:MFS family permease